jgi:hypothetical protein
LANLRYDFGMARADLIAAAPETSGPVREAAMDGVLTFAEYESSVLSMIACVEAQRAFVRPDDPHLSSRGLYTWLIGWPAGKGQPPDTIAGCIETELGILDLLWKEYLAPSETETRAAMKDMANCLEANGMADLVPESLSPSEFQRIPVQLAAAGRDAAIPLHFKCAHVVQDRFGLIGFAEEGNE